MHPNMPERRTVHPGSEFRCILLRLQQHRLHWSHMCYFQQWKQPTNKQHVSMHPRMPERRHVHAGSQLRGLLL